MAHVYKRGKTWTVRISKREKIWDPKKHEYISQLRQKQKGGFHTKAEANAYGIKLEAASLNGLEVMKNPVFADYFEKWVDEIKLPAIRASSGKKYITYKHTIRDNWGQTKINDITKRSYQIFLNRYGAKRAPNTVSQFNSAVRSCINFAYENGVIAKDFTKNVQLNANKSHIKKVEYLSIEEIKALIAACIARLDPIYMSEYIILTAILTGARFGEIAALKWSDIDFKNKTISITKSWNGDHKTVGPPKTPSSVRTIHVPEMLLKYIKQLKNNGYEFVFGIHRSPHLPPNHGGVNDTLKRIMKKAGIYKQGFHFHSLRHSHVAYLLAHKVDIYAISKRLGHSNVSITLGVYAYMIDEFKKQENKKIIDSLNQLS